MVTENHQRIRLLMMVEILRQKTTADNPLTTNELINELSKIDINCDRRTLGRDVELLNKYGYTVMTKTIGRQNCYYMDSQNFSLNELKILMDAVQAASFVSQKQTELLIDKIADIAGSRRVEVLKENIVCFNTVKHTDEVIFENITELEKALCNRKRVSFYYFDRNEDGKKIYRKEKERYVVEPMALIFNDDNYYLMTWSSKCNSIANYRVDRMDEVEAEEDDISGNAFVEDVDTVAFTKMAFKMYGGTLTDMVLEFDDKLIGVVHDKFGEKTKMIRTVEGRCVASVKVQIAPSFWGWMFQFAGEMKIISPESLMEEYRERARKVLI